MCAFRRASNATEFVHTGRERKGLGYKFGLVDAQEERDEGKGGSKSRRGLFIKATKKYTTNNDSDAQRALVALRTSCARDAFRGKADSIQRPVGGSHTPTHPQHQPRKLADGHAKTRLHTHLERLLEHLGGEGIIRLQPQRLVVTADGVVVPALSDIEGDKARTDTQETTEEELQTPRKETRDKRQETRDRRTDNH